jgi:hypothetical protein
MKLFTIVASVFASSFAFASQNNETKGTKAGYLCSITKGPSKERHGVRKEYQSFPSIQEAHNPLYPIMVSNGFFVVRLPLSAYSSGDAVRLCVAPKFITSRSTPLKSLSGSKQK